MLEHPARLEVRRAERDGMTHDLDPSFGVPTWTGMLQTGSCTMWGISSPLALRVYDCVYPLTDGVDAFLLVSAQRYRVSAVLGADMCSHAWDGQGTIGHFGRVMAQHRIARDMAVDDPLKPLTR
ncbi:hypothetical protein [Haliangium sp. UPWRP_2]|uniref:hypothetical protein n=1 Tax=Haliangium sp. UPWRP_2 TaxID=1931276 RepID=UPI001E45C941|nr:hypothetical protein [Haliangium sp. UPWRP_2]